MYELFYAFPYGKLKQQVKLLKNVTEKYRYTSSHRIQSFYFSKVKELINNIFFFQNGKLSMN